MKRFVFLTLICFFLFNTSQAFAQEEEPILIIDPHGHSSTIYDIMFTPNGETLISTSMDKTIRVWDVESGDLIKTLRHQIGEGHQGTIHGAAISPDGKTLAIGGWPYGDGDYGIPAYLFDLESGEIMGLLQGHTDVVMSMDFSQDGKWLATGSESVIRIWDMSNIGDDPVIILEAEDGVYDLAFAPDGKNLVSGHIDNMVRLWDLSKSFKEAQTSGTQTLDKPKKVLKKHSSVANCVAYSPDGKYIASADFDGNYFLWDAKKGKVKKKFPVMEASGDIAFSRDSKHVILSNGNKAQVYTVPKGKKVKTFKKHVSPIEMSAFSNNVTATAIHGNDLVATAGGNDYDIYIWDLKTGDVKTHIAGKGKRVEAVAFGENYELAFGNTSGGINKIGPLERSFDFAEMTLNQKKPPKKAFPRTQTKHQGKKLQYTSGRKNPENWYTLKVKGGGTIKNERRHGWVRSYTFTPDGDVVIGSSHVLRLHSSDGELIHNFPGHTGEVWDVSVSTEGNVLASASDDQTIKLWNLETGENLVTLFIARDNEWVCWTPQGYYAASAGGEKYIGWQINQGMDTAAKYYPVSVFRKRFHYPQLVKHTIALGSFELASEEVQVREVAVTDVLPPKVRWISPERPEIEIDQPSIQIQAEIESDSDLAAIKVLVNGRTQATGRGLAMAGDRKAALDKTIDQEVSLVPGRNEIVIFAANTDAGASSDARIVLYSAEELKPDLYMVSIGISGYQLSDLQLTYADDDANAISKVFREQEGQLYRHVIIKELYDQEATQSNIINAIKWLQTQATHKDVAVLFIAAHGTNEEGKYYLLPADSDPSQISKTGVSWNDFSETLGNLSARVLLFLDTCHSGQLGVDVQAQPGQVDNTEAIRTLSSDEYGVVILAASTGREFSLEHPDWKHGAFTKALIEALEEGKADYSSDGIILLRELDLYVAERVDVLTNSEQHPTTQKPSTISRFPVVQMKD